MTSPAWTVALADRSTAVCPTSPHDAVVLGTMRLLVVGQNRPVDLPEKTIAGSFKRLQDKRSVMR